jgi:hypothetical protein
MEDSHVWRLLEQLQETLYIIPNAMNRDFNEKKYPPIASLNGYQI